ncbi:hypothetical protein QMTAC487_34430 [Sphaerotilus sp. FB-3]|uniref:putative Ig domain-containing protein n=1 Tax=Sphaerotilus sp. FB-3 TaxID=2913396 RepID=UPI00203DAE37|nr:putative Ig domain-containing protein [Sphaerotilus sp. FB-3]GKQ59582.1 hypothetical protein QMTAC487_34430 [Sphaerotilus sp. FB-3]
MLPSGPRPGLEELEPRLLYSADAALLLGGLPVADVRQVASASTVASSQADSGARWLLVDRRAEDWDRLLAEAQALDPSRPLQLRWVEPDEDGAALRAAATDDGEPTALIAAWTDADGRAWLGRSVLEVASSPLQSVATAEAPVETGPAEDWTLAVRRELVIIDGRIEGAGALAALWWQDENSTRTLEVIVTDPSRDGLSQIGELLAARGGQEGLAALHLVGHGTAGQFSFGGDAIDAGTLARHEAALRAWGQALAENGDLLLYGCDTGAGSQGEALLEALQALTGADVAASTDATGGSAAGADWDLEATRGVIETSLAAPVHEALMRWEGRLAAYVVSSDSDNGAVGTLRWAIQSANASPGADTITFANGGVPVTILLNAMLPPITDRITIDGSSGGVPTVAIDGRLLGAGADGLQLYTGSDGSILRGLALQNFSQDGIDISGSGNHVIAGNRIGLDLFGNAAGNQQGVNLWNTSGNRIGGSSTADRNIISGNSGVGIYIGGGSTANRIEGNWIGLDSTGTAAMANPYGILVQSAGNTLGGAGSGAGNIVSGNLDGIVLSGPSASANQILGNQVGLSASGGSAVGNAFDGIRLEGGASDNTVGGAGAGLRNVVSGNGRDGVRIIGEASDGNAVLGNWIGSNADGTAVLGNGGDGIFILDGGDSSRIGGAAPGEGNWVIGAGLFGIEIDGDSTGTTIRGNRVGTDLAGTANFGAVQNGILLENGAAQSSIVENTVAFSGRGGVYTDGIDLLSTAGSGNLISRNTLYSNAGQDINLGASGLDGNDSLDADSGANDLQNHPLLSSATLGTGTLQVLGQLDSAASALYRIEFFADPGGQGDARVYLGQTTVTSDAGGRASIDALLEASLAAGATVTATATRVSSGSTSEAAVPVTVAARANTAPGFVAASGQVITPVSGGDDWIRTMQIQDDGRILVAGHQPGAGGGQDVLLMRYRADGTLDTTFGSGGRVTVAAASFGGTTAQVWAMAVQADGAIVVAGQATVGGVQYALVQRYLADGSLDSSFSGDGTALWGDVSQFCEASAVAIDAQGRIVLGGTVSGATAVARVTADGMLDTAFGGGNGYAWVDAGLGADLVGALAIQSDGRILLGGSAGNDHALVRWNDDGTLDAGFGSGGIVRTDVAGGFDMIRALVVQDDGRILAGGYSTQAGGDIDFTLLRYLASGSVDTGFSGDGRVTTDLGGADIVQAMVRDASGRIVLAGYDGSGRIALVRHLADGSLDTAFGQGGLVQQAIGASSGAGALALRPDGRLVAAGWSSDGTQRDPLLLGLLTDGSLDPGVGSAAATLGGTVAWTEGATAVVLDADVRLNDADLAQAGSYAGATLTLARQGGAQAQDQLAFDGLVVTVSGTAVLVDGVQVGSYTFTGGQMQVSFGAQATQDRVDRLARHIVYWNSSDAPPASVTIAWTLADGNTGAQGSGGALAGAGSVTVAITAVNDAPTLALPGRQSTPVDTPLVLDSASGRAPQVADADAALLQVTLTSDGHGLLTLSGTTGLSFSAGDGSADTAMTFSGSAAAINAALDGLRFAPSAAYQGGATIGFSVSDLGGSGSGGTLTTTGSVIVEVGALRFRDGSAGYAGTQDTYIDDSVPGSAFGTSTTVRADEGSPRQTALIRFDQIIGNGAGQVPAGATITSATLSLYVTERDAADTVALHRMKIDWSESSTHASLVNGIQADGSDAEASGIAIDAGLSGWINISGLAAAVQAWVDGAPNFGWAIVSDADDTWAFASSESADAMLRPYLTVAYTVPQAPVLGTSAGGASYVENAAPVAVDPALTLSDADSTQLSGASVVISAGHVAAQDVLSWAAVTGISGSWNAATGTLSFSGTAALADYRTLLRSVSYANSSDSPSGVSRTLSFTVTDTTGLSSAAATRSIQLSAVNDAPTVATPIADQSATEDQPFSFQIPAGTFADVDAGDSLSYTTSTLPSWLSFNAATRTFSGTPVNADVGALTITVTAKDGSNATASDSFVLTIANVNDAPTVATPLADQSATQDQPFSFQIPSGTFADVDAGDSLSYTTSALPSWLSFNAATRTFSGTPVNADVGALTITVTAKDGSNATASDSFVLTIANVNDAPTVATPLADQSATQDQPFSFQIPSGTFADVDAGDSLSYTTSALPSWLSFNAATRTFSGTPVNADVGALTITVTAKDGSNATASDSFVLTVTNVNDAPTVASPIVDQSATQDQPFSFQIPAGTFADVDAGDSLSYTTSTLPSWLSFNAATRTFSGTPANADVGALTITVTAKDGSNATATDSFVLTVTNVNDAPTVATPIADQSATEDQPFSFQLPAGTFVDVDAGDSLSYTTSTLPSWLSFDAATRTFSGTPANADVGALTITVTAKDGSNAAASDSFVLTIANVNDAPTVASPIADQSATQDQPFSFQLPAGTFADVDAGDSLSYTTSTLPSWLSFNAATRIFSGTPANADVGALTITVTVKDGSNAAASDSFVLTIANVNDAPILQAGGPLTLEEGGHQVLTLADLLPADVDDDERSLVFERVGGAPAGRLERVDAPGVAVDRFSAGDLADGLIRYVHDGSESVSDRLELRVRDASGALSDPVRLEIVITPVDDEAPRIVSSDGQARVVLDHSENSPWQRVMQASDADRPLSVLQWRIAGGADAARFEIDADSGELRLLGLLDREQPQDADRDNHYEVLIEVSDGRQAATQQLLLRITDVDEAPEIEIGLLQVDQGMRLRLDESLLRAQDVDSAADVLVYRVVAVENGRFVAAGGDSVLTTFSQADVAAGRVVFLHDENSLAARFSLVLSDGRNESGVMSIEIAVRERGFDAGSMPTEPPPDRMPASSALVVSGIEPADPMRERTQQAQASQEIVRAAVLRGLAAREGGGAGAAELVAGDLMAGWVDALRRFATLSASETQAARPGALRGEVGFSVDLMRLPDSDLLVLLDVVLDLAGFEATALIRPVSEGVGGTQTASGETARSAGTDEPENLLQREWQSGTVARTGAVVMSAGALFWAVRAGGLAASLAFASPVWWRLDPLPVLQAARRETAGAEAGRRGWRDTGVTGELAGLAEDLLDRQG